MSIIPWMRWVAALPQSIVATMQGVLPSLLLDIVMNMVPRTLRVLVNCQGSTCRHAVERNIQICYFTFLLIQVFLTVSLSASVTAILSHVTSIESIPEVLARNLPKASNYFFSFIIIHTFTSVTSILVPIKGLLRFYIISPIFDRTPREQWKRLQSLYIQRYGTFVPVYTNIACIDLLPFISVTIFYSNMPLGLGLIYSIITPLILPLCVVE